MRWPSSAPATVDRVRRLLRTGETCRRRDRNRGSCRGFGRVRRGGDERLAVVEVTRAATRAAGETGGEHAEVLSTLGQLRIDRAVVQRAARRHWRRRRCDHSTPYT